MAGSKLKAGSLEALCDQIIHCRLCPRLVEYRQEIARKKRAAYRDWEYWGKPLPGFGDPHARLLIVGLAPAAHGGNRTGRVFTGDRSGTFLMQGMHRAGLSNIPDSVSRDDGLELHDAYIVAITRCAPPDNKPLPDEILNCRPYLLKEMELLPRLSAVLALGKIAMDGYLAALNERGHRIKRPEFKHAGEYQLPDGLPRLFVSYHPSQQNTQTGKLTSAMFDQVFQKIRRYLDSL